MIAIIDKHTREHYVVALKRNDLETAARLAEQVPGADAYRDAERYELAVALVKQLRRLPTNIERVLELAEVELRATQAGVVNAKHALDKAEQRHPQALDRLVLRNQLQDGIETTIGASESARQALQDQLEAAAWTAKNRMENRWQTSLIDGAVKRPD